MTPGKWLKWGTGGNVHVHSDEEMAQDVKQWRPGASCSECPWFPQEAPEESTVVLTQDETGGKP